MGSIEPLGTHIARLLPGVDAATLHRLERAAQLRTFSRRDMLHGRGITMPPSMILDGHAMLRRVAETGRCVPR